MTYTQYRITVDGTQQPITDESPANWPTIVYNAQERGVLARCETRTVFDWDSLFLQGLQDPETGANPEGWLIIPDVKIASPWRIEAEIPAMPAIIGGLIGAINA